MICPVACARILLVTGCVAAGGALTGFPVAADETAPTGTVLTLQQSVAIAVRNSPKARAAGFTRDAALSKAERDRPVARPTITATASGTVQGPHVLFPTADGKLATVLPDAAARLDLVVDQPLYRAGAVEARKRFAAESAVADLDYQKSILDLTLAVEQAYIAVLRAEAGEKTASGRADSAQQFQSLVRERISAGVAKPVDEQTTAALVAEAQAGVSRAEGAATLADMAFNRLLGRPIMAPVSVAPLVDVPEPAPAPDSAIEEALHIRPDLIELQRSVDAARLGVSLAKSQSSPTLSLRGELTEQSPTAFFREHYMAATLELRWPILDGGASRLDARQATAELHELEAALDDAKQGAALEVVQAWQQMRDAQAQIVLIKAQLAGSEATAIVAHKAYDVGSGTAVEVRDADREVSQAQEREVDALYALREASAEFDHARGAAVAPLR